MNQKKEIKELRHGGMKSLIKKSIELGIKVSFLSYERPLIKLEFKGKTIFIRKGTIPLARRMGDMTRNKNLTKSILSNIGIKVSRGIVSSSFNEASKLIKKNKLKYPLIAKPLYGSLAKGVTWNVKNKEDLKKAVGLISKGNKEDFEKFLVEEMFIGDEFRILILEKKVISCVKKIPATIIGDGKSSIKELIKKFDKTRLKGFKIKIDKIAKETLREKNVNLSSVLDKNFILKLRNNLNMSDGGRCVDCTDIMDKHFKIICEKAVESLGLTYGGIDFMAKNISSPKSPYIIIEVNPNPYYNMHEKPLVEGKGVDVSLEILKSLFSNLK